MKTILAMDESGNTQPIIAVGLVSIPYNEIPKINSIFSIIDADPIEIKVLYEKKSEGEFRYTDLRTAFVKTRLEVYDNFLKQKLVEISKLDVQAYISIFPNPNNNEERLQRLLREAQDLLHKWAHQNKEAAFSKELEINVDQQVFPETYLFQYCYWRNQYRCELIPKKLITEEKTRKIYPEKENTIQITDANSKTLKSIQLTDLLVGCAREYYVRKIRDYFEIVKNLFRKEHMRIQLTDYSPAKRGFIPSSELPNW